MKSPDTYAEWVEAFDAFRQRENDEENMEAMESGTFIWEPVVAEMFMKEMISAIEKRLGDAQKRFQKSTAHFGGSDNEMTAMLISLRREMKFIMRFASLDVLGDERRSQLRKMVSDAADRIQSSLESSAASDRSGRTAVILKNHRVNDLK